MKKILLISTCLASFAFAQVFEETLTKKEFPNNWPFTINEVSLRCMGADIITVMDPENYNDYPLNNQAIRQSEKLFLDGTSADPILKKNSKKTVDQLIARGLKLCKPNAQNKKSNVSDNEKMVRNFENQVISKLGDPLSFKAISSEIVEIKKGKIVIKLYFYANDDFGIRSKLYAEGEYDAFGYFKAITKFEETH